MIVLTQKLILIKSESCDNIKHLNKCTNEVQIISRDFHKMKIFYSITCERCIFLLMVANIPFGHLLNHTFVVKANFVLCMESHCHN